MTLKGHRRREFYRSCYRILQNRDRYSAVSFHLIHVIYTLRTEMCYYTKLTMLLAKFTIFHIYRISKVLTIYSCIVLRKNT